MEICERRLSLFDLGICLSTGDSCGDDGFEDVPVGVIGVDGRDVGGVDAADVAVDDVFDFG